MLLFKTTITKKYRTMEKSGPLQARFPKLGRCLGKVSLTSLPTPVRESSYRCEGQTQAIWIKEDHLSGESYGGNKVRKLEYLLKRAIDKHCTRVATFGAVGSHHALATALYARQLGLDCTAFLSHQTRVASIPATLNTHLQIDTQIVRYGGAYSHRIDTLRRTLRDQKTWIIPAGGSSWLGTIGFIEAGLELAAQIEAKLLPRPDRIYVATGTMSTAAGLGLGLALAGLPIEIHAIRISRASTANDAVLERLMRKTATMLNRLDTSFPPDLAARTNIVFRHDYFAEGYALSNAETDAAIVIAEKQFGLILESTYTGKAMAAMLGDMNTSSDENARFLFWNTYHSKPLTAASDSPLDKNKLPAEFLRYFD
jgi:1-aminocyclopropane-1-carboxylate deaminase/D-cysteine desulfhydrase-like pyridoxal-dependent ACC family enzyme